MSAYHGPQGKGAARQRRAAKRAEAEARDALTVRERRRSARLVSSRSVVAGSAPQSGDPNQ